MIKVNSFDVKLNSIKSYATTPVFKGTETSQNSDVEKNEKLPNVTAD